MTLKLRLRWSLTGIILGLIGGSAPANVVAVVSSKSAIVTLNEAQVIDIFLGRVSRFPDGTPATPVDQVEGSAERNEFYEKVAGKTPAQLKAYWAKVIFTGRGQPPKTVSDSVELKKLIGTNPTTIGYLDEKWVDASVRVLYQQPNGK